MTTVTYWEKVPIFNRKKRETAFKLAPVSAVVIGDSIPICSICREPEDKHNQPKKRGIPWRSHAFTKPIGGLTLKVTNEMQTYVMENVQKGKRACHWTEKE